MKTWAGGEIFYERLQWEMMLQFLRNFSETLFYFFNVLKDFFIKPIYICRIICFPYEILNHIEMVLNL